MNGYGPEYPSPLFGKGSRPGGTLKRQVRDFAGLTASPGSERGFSLLEILVALSVMAIALVVVLQLFSSGLTGLAVSDDYMNAVVRAETKMRAILDDELSESAWSEVTDEGYRFDASVGPVAQERTDNLPVQLMEVRLTVHWTRGLKERSFTLRTMKVVSRKA